MSRIENDFLGDREIADDCYYGVQTSRGRDNFHITEMPMSQEPFFVIAFGYVKKAAALAKERGAKRCLPLKVSGPFHTPLMAPAGDALKEHFRNVFFGEPAIPVLFNCLGDVKPEGVTIQELLVKQVQSSVFMEDTIRSMATMGLDALVEIGPGKALTGFVRKTVPEMPVYTVETVADVENLVQLVKENDR